MKIKPSCLLAAAALSLSLPFCLRAQTFTLLHTFTNSPDGDRPFNGLILSGSTLYGTATEGGGGAGMVFRINTDGTCFTNLHSFPATGADATNIGGAYPGGVLVLSGNMLYGATLLGGTSGNGTLYAVDTGGMNFTNLHDFTTLVSLTNSDGANPQCTLALSGGVLFGTASAGGAVGGGALFSVCTNGTGFTNLYSFSNNDPGPQGGVVFSSNMLYGESVGGTYGDGYLFRINTNGTGFMNFYSFSMETSEGNSDGAYPAGNLTASGNTLYGTTPDGGTANDGTIFKITTDGKGFANLHNFKGADGANPAGGLFLTNNVLYGMASGGGTSGWGTVYQLDLNNSNLVTLYNFPAASGSSKTNSDGGAPGAAACLAVGGNALYGTAAYGGLNGDGTVVAVTLPTPPQLSINPSGPNVVLTWPTNTASFTLQSTTNLVSPSIWESVLPAPVVVNMRNTVTNPVSGVQMFYRLSQ
jgi:uncharacterized repeat protein (TIGR03803 family)